MKNLLLCLIFVFGATMSYAQENIIWTNPAIGNILTGDFNPDDYMSGEVLDDPAVIAAALESDMDPARLKVYLEEMSFFENRNTGSDTLSTTRGIGAARNWALDMFQSFSDAEEGRMQVGFLQFDQEICSMGRHKNIVAVLPGSGPQFDESVLVEAHFDSRCDTACDGDCEAHGMEDNGSGSAVILELSRILSKYSFNRTLIFMLTIGEEQGLLGAEAMAQWCQTNNVKLKAVLNNDIIGGVICGETASPPGCPSLNHVDSTNVRIYSRGVMNSPNKQLARWTKLQYEEMIVPITDFANVINILTPEDRDGRGGDHIPFPGKGFPALRFTSANEHGDGNPAQDDYHDRQHTSTDRLGIDTDGDSVLDSFFVDFNYLGRNGMINGISLAMAACSPVPPVEFNMEAIPGGYRFEIDDPNDIGRYRVSLKELNGNEWIDLRDFTSAVDSITNLPTGFYVLSACTVDENGIESLFSNERFGGTTGMTTSTQDLQIRKSLVHLMQNTPNPFDEATMINVVVEGELDYKEAVIIVHSLEGKEIKRFPLQLNLGLNEVLYSHNHHGFVPGVYAYSLIIDGEVFDTKKMIYAY